MHACKWFLHFYRFRQSNYPCERGNFANGIIYIHIMYCYMLHTCQWAWRSHTPSTVFGDLNRGKALLAWHQKVSYEQDWAPHLDWHNPNALMFGGVFWKASIAFTAFTWSGLWFQHESAQHPFCTFLVIIVSKNWFYGKYHKRIPEVLRLNLWMTIRTFIRTVLMDGKSMVMAS